MLKRIAVIELLSEVNFTGMANTNSCRNKFRICNPNRKPHVSMFGLWSHNYVCLCA